MSIKKEKSNLILDEKLDKIISISQNRGFFFNTASIYGGRAGFFTYGHLGKFIKNNWESLWRKNIIGLDDNFFEIQGNNILPEKVFEASGHIKNFSDPFVQCKKCNSRFRADTLLEKSGIKNVETFNFEEIDSIIKKRKILCEFCKGELSKVNSFNMMFPVFIGAITLEKAYLSPETAQSAYLAFKEEFYAVREKLPLGLAIIDKAYRNEISPRQMFFRLREFTQAELQIFFDPDKINEHKNWKEVEKKELLIKFSNKNNIEKVSCNSANKKYKIPQFYLYYLSKIQDFYLNVLNIPKNRFRFRELNNKERAFYNKIHFDIELKFDSLADFKEVAGVHYRTDHDLMGHSKVSNKKLQISFGGKKFIPHVLELSFGVDRNIYALLDIFYKIGKEGAMFCFPPILAPYSCAVLPLVRSDNNLKIIAEEIYKNLKESFNVLYDDSSSIGKRYARNDEIGIPYCITIDSDSIKNKDVTLRNRDDTKQIRIKISNLKEIIDNLINKKIKFEEVGKIIKR
jgi:glycyl-tRNA synthetase